jgi:hypothetical protein
VHFIGSYYSDTHTYKDELKLCIYLYIYLFFYWRYNPLWVLAFSVIFFHSALSSHCFLHRLTSIIYKSSSMPSIHLLRCLPLVLVPMGFHCNILLGVIIYPHHVTQPSYSFYKSYFICIFY